ncbi:MAG: hypothetical protein WDO73_17195 [Ignavibacteriota bacterium]
MSLTAHPSGAELVADAHQALRQAHHRLLDPTPQGIDYSRAAFATAVQRLSELHGLLDDSPDSGCGLLPAMKALHIELETVTVLLQSAARHQSNLLQRMLQASATAEPGYFAMPAETGGHLHVNG